MNVTHKQLAGHIGHPRSTLAAQLFLVDLITRLEQVSELILYVLVPTLEVELAYNTSTSKSRTHAHIHACLAACSRRTNKQDSKARHAPRIQKVQCEPRGRFHFFASFQDRVCIRMPENKMPILVSIWAFRTNNMISTVSFRKSSCFFKYTCWTPTSKYTSPQFL